MPQITIPAAVRALLEELTTDTTQERAERISSILSMYPEPKPEPVITSDTPVDYGNDAIREHAEQLVQQNINYCVSSLIYELNQNSEAAEKLGVSDDLISLSQRDDWEEPARDHLGDLDAEGLADVAEYFDLNADSKLDDVLAFLDEEDKWQELCDYARLDPHVIDAYEHWIVDNWFAGQLESEGEMVVRDFLGMTIWGRATTGQSISMDYVILKIARDALAR